MLETKTCAPFRPVNLLAAVGCPHGRGAASSSNRKVRGRMRPEPPCLTSALRECPSAQMSRSRADRRKKGVSRELSWAVAEKTSGSWQAVINCLVFFAEGVVAVAVFASAVAILSFSLGVPASAYSTDCPLDISTNR